MLSMINILKNADNKETLIDLVYKNANNNEIVEISIEQPKLEKHCDYWGCLLNEQPKFAKYCNSITLTSLRKIM